MKLVKVKKQFFDLCRQNNVDEELLENKDGRPCVLIVKLKYKNQIRPFIVPLRSNLSPTTPNWQYLGLPPNSATKPNHKHAIHYIKLFPIKKEFIDSYERDKEPYYTMLLKIIDKNEKKIIDACQNYLEKYEMGEKHCMTPDIDGIINKIIID